MPDMKSQSIAHLEAALERLVEGTFANLFGKQIRAQDIALELARALEDKVRAASGSDPRPLAPDQYAIYLNPEIQQQLLQRQPALVEILSRHIVELATESGYRLADTPQITILPDARLDTHKLAVKAAHTNQFRDSTAVMKAVEIEPQPALHNPQLLINGERTVQINSAIVNIGRNRDNHIVLDDPHVSRHHLQLRQRFGRYVLFDVNSREGTFVNEVSVKEHHLRSGDVIRIGTTRLIYVEDDPSDQSHPGTTGIMDPVEDIDL